MRGTKFLPHTEHISGVFVVAGVVVAVGAVVVALVVVVVDGVEGVGCGGAPINVGSGSELCLSGVVIGARSYQHHGTKLKASLEKSRALLCCRR
jgi:hypothetical protein